MLREGTKSRSEAPGRAKNSNLWGLQVMFGGFKFAK